MRLSVGPLVLLLAISSGASAMPLRPGQLQKSGTVEVKVRRITEVKPADTTAPPPAVALEGEHKLLVILVATQDSPWPSGYDPSRYEELIFDKSSSSMREYYREQSYGRYTLTGQVVGPITIEGRMADYGYDRAQPDNSRVRVLIERAMKAAAKTVKLSDYDTHDARGKKGKDGVIDHVMFLYAEKSGKFDGFSPIWPHRGSLDVDLGDGMRLASYVILNHAARLGVYVHEFGHDIGLPDLYDRDYSSYGVGDWCTMASGSWAGDAEHPVHFSAWAKIRLGWITPQIIAKPMQNVRVPSSSERPFALKIPIGEVDSREYFVIENRRKVGFDQLLPAEGLLIWHIDEAKGDNDDENHKMVDVVEGARDQDLDRMNNFSRPNYVVDVFSAKGMTKLDDSTDPSARAYSGQGSKIAIRVLTPPERVMSIDIDPEIFNPGGVPYDLAEDGYTFGRFSSVALGKGAEGLMQLEATPGGYIAFGMEAFVSGRSGQDGKVTLRLYKDQGGKPGKVLASETASVKIQPEGYAWVRTRLSAGEGKGIKLAANERIWAGAISEDGKTFAAMNPFSTTKRARFRAKASDPLGALFNFKEGKTPVADYVVRVSGFGYVEGSERPEPLANDADELVVRMKKADARADKKQFAEALTDYEAILTDMQKEPRRYESWIPVIESSIGVAAYEMKKYDVALDRFSMSLRRAQAAKDDVNTADIYENLGETSFYAGNMNDAKSYCERSRALNAQLRRGDRLVENLYWLGRALQESGNKEGGTSRIKEAQALVKSAFAKDATEEGDWNKRIQLALLGTPEDKPKVAERTTELKESDTREKHKAKYTDLLQFLTDDADDK
jgi:immune inhibitor A